MKKLLIMLMVLFTTLNVNAKCDWSSLKLKQWNERNYYKWQVSGQVLDDTCVDWNPQSLDATDCDIQRINDLVEIS